MKKVALAFENNSVYDKVDQNDEIELTDIINSLKLGKVIVAKNKTKGFTFNVLHGLED